MVQYYSLQEAAARLHVTPEQLKDMAKKNEVRAFQDRGNLRFRSQEIDELARSRGLDSDLDLPLGELPKSSDPKSGGPKSGGPKSGGPKSGGPKSGRGTKHVSQPTDEDFEINLTSDNEEVSIGQDPSSGGSASKNTPRNTSTRSPKPKKKSSLGPPSSPPSPRPKPGSDSDVRLVGDSSELAFQIDSEVKVEKGPSPGPKTPGSRKSKVESAPDSGVRIVPLDESSDSDVKIVPDEQDSHVPLGQTKSKTPSDSDIRLEELHTDSGKGKHDQKGLVTEEIDLDAEEMKAAKESAARKKQKPKPRNVESSSQLPTVSPFELSDPDVQLDPKSGRNTGAKIPSKVSLDQKKIDDKDSSSDFELTPVKESSSPIELGSDEMPPIKLDDSNEEVGLGELSGSGGGTSGINLKDPVDSGISLEQGGSDEMELEVSVNAGNTPKPAAKVDSSSEFELSLDDSDAEEEEGSSSEFELTLDEPSSPTEDGTSSEFELSLDLDESSSEEMESLEDKAGGSDSEFELTIDDGGGIDVDESAAQEEEDKDIFETDFEVPALDEESGSEAVALDEEESDLDASSDFDLDVDEDNETDMESGSEVVPLDEAEGEDLAPVARKKKGGRTAIADDEDMEAPSELEQLDEAETQPAEEPEESLEEEEEAAAPARRSWGYLTPLCATASTFIMFFVCLMSYEMIHSMMGYHTSTPVSRLILHPLARQIADDSFPKD